MIRWSALGEHLVEHRRDVPLRPDDARDLGVGRVGEQQVDALAAKPREPGQVGQPPVERQLVHLEVAGVQHDAGRGLDRHGERVGDRVVHREEFKVEGSERVLGSLLDLHYFRSQPVLGELGLHQGERQLGPDQGDVAALAEQVGHRADVVLVGVREDQRLDVVEPVFQVAEVRQDQVDARLVRLGEQDAAVDDEQPPEVLEDRHVPADLTEPAERDDAQAVARQRRRRGQVRMRESSPGSSVSGIVLAASRRQRSGLGLAFAARRRSPGAAGRGLPRPAGRAGPSRPWS